MRSSSGAVISACQHFKGEQSQQNTPAALFHCQVYLPRPNRKRQKPRRMRSSSGASFSARRASRSSMRAASTSMRTSAPCSLLSKPPSASRVALQDSKAILRISMTGLVRGPFERHQMAPEPL